MDGMSIWDAQAGKSRLCSRQCATCIFQPGNRMRLRPGRLRDMVEQARSNVDGLDGTYITCHETLPYSGTGVAPAVCRGFYDRYSTQALQLIGRLWGWVEIDPPDHIGGIDMADPPTEERWMRGDEVAHLFRVDYKTLVRWDAAGRLPAVRTPANHRRWREHDVAAVRAGHPLPTRDADGRVVAESTDRPRETAVHGLTPGRGA